MKPETVPTAPQLRAKRQTPSADTATAEVMAATTRRQRRIGWLVLTVLLSLAAGACSALFVLAIPLQWPRVAQFLNISSSDVVVIPATNETSTATLVAAIEQRQFDAIVEMSVDDEVVGLGLLVTNDGWLVTPRAVVGDALSITVTLASGKTVVSDDIVHDDYSDISFVHIPKTNLVVVDLPAQDVVLGDAVIAMQTNSARQPQVRVAYLQSVAEPVAAHATTSHTTVLYLVDRTLLGIPVGTPLFDYRAQVIGMLTNEQSVLPTAAWADRLEQLLNDDALQPLLPEITYTLSDQGAKVITAEAVEIQAEDIITEVNGEVVNSQHDLSALIQEQTKESLSITLLRGGKTKTIELTR